MDFSNIKNVSVEGIDPRDYPDLVDAFITYAEWENGKPLTDEELDELNDDSDLRYDYVAEAFINNYLGA